MRAITPPVIILAWIIASGQGIHADTIKFDIQRPFQGLFGGGSQVATPQPSLGDGICLISPKAIPVILSGNYSCPPHYYCPNIDPNDPLSVPSMCPPTLECQKERLVARICPPQGKYEPTVCFHHIHSIIAYKLNERDSRVLLDITVPISVKRSFVLRGHFVPMAASNPFLASIPSPYVPRVRLNKRITAVFC
jgi:hypothetical protein